MGRRFDEAAGALVIAFLLIVALVPAYGFFEWPRQVDTQSLARVLTVAGLLGLVAAATAVRSPILRVLLALAAVSILWCPVTAWPGYLPFTLRATATPSCPAGCAVCSPLFGSTGLRTWLGVAAAAAALPIAIWRRAPGRGADGRPIASSRAMRALAATCIVGGPLIGLVGWLEVTPGDIYGGPLGLGVLVGLFGLMAFAGHAAFYGLIGRPALSALLACAYAGLVIANPVVRAGLSGALRLSPGLAVAALVMAVLLGTPPLVVLLRPGGQRGEASARVG